VSIVLLLFHVVPTTAQSPDRILGGLLGIMEKQVQKEEARRIRREQKNAYSRRTPDTPASLPKIDGIELGAHFDQGQSFKEFNLQCQPSAAYRSMTSCSGDLPIPGPSGQ